jgi:hypothetical protein
MVQINLREEDLRNTNTCRTDRQCIATVSSFRQRTTVHHLFARLFTHSLPAGAIFPANQEQAFALTTGFLRESIDEPVYPYTVNKF